MYNINSFILLLICLRFFFNLFSNAVRYAKQSEQNYLAIYSEKTSKSIVII